MHNLYPLNTSLVAIDGNACYSKHNMRWQQTIPSLTHTHTHNIIIYTGITCVGFASAQAHPNYRGAETKKAFIHRLDDKKMHAILSCILAFNFER